MTSTKDKERCVIATDGEQCVMTTGTQSLCNQLGYSGKKKKKHTALSTTVMIYKSPTGGVLGVLGRVHNLCTSVLRLHCEMVASYYTEDTRQVDENCVVKWP